MNAVVKPQTLTDAERLEWIAKHFTSLDFGTPTTVYPDTNAAGYIVRRPETEDEYAGFDAMYAPKGGTFQKPYEADDFREALDYLIRELG